MDLRQLEFFLALAEERHFGRAAARLRISQPHLSRQIKALEEAIDVKLFDRTSRKVVVTQAGLALVPHAKLILEEAEDGITAAKRAQRGETGLLRLAYVLTGGSDVLPGLLDSYRRQHPHVDVTATHMSTHAQVAALHDRRLDIGILHPPVSSKDLQTEVIRRDLLVAVLPLNHHLAAADSIRLRELANEDFVMWSHDSRMFPEVQLACKRAGFTPRVRQEASGTPMLVDLVAEGMGVAIVPAFTSTTARVAVKPLIGSQVRDPLAVAWRRDDRSEPVRTFVALLQEHRAATVALMPDAHRIDSESE